MKKLYFRVFLILCPVILYVGIFFANDPYNYYGIMGSGDTSALIGKMLDYKNHAYEGVIIGDSRIVSYEPEFPVANLAYGGAVGKEMNSLFQWCCDAGKQLPKKVCIVTGFYNMNMLMRQDRVSSTAKTLESPFNYAFNFENLNALLKKLLLGDEQDGHKSEVTPEQKKENFALSKQNSLYYWEGYAYDEPVIEELCGICDFCKLNGIDIKIVIPPLYTGLFDILKEYHLEDIMDEYKAALSHHAKIYDFEYRACGLSDRYDDYSDYFHFHNATYDEFLQCIEGEESPYCRVWENGMIVKKAEKDEQTDG